MIPRKFWLSRDVTVHLVETNCIASTRGPQGSATWLAIALVAVFAVATSASAEENELSSVPLSRSELLAVYHACEIQFRPGQGMVPCLIDQAEKVARGKRIRQLSKSAQEEMRKQLGR